MKIPERSRVKFSVGRLAAGLVLIASIAGAGFASAAERNLGTRPAGVPADYVITPFGYFSPACVQQIHSGDQVTLSTPRNSMPAKTRGLRLMLITELDRR